MIGYVTVGADDLLRAEAFYSAFLPNLGFELEVSGEGLSYSIPIAPNRKDDPLGHHSTVPKALLRDIAPFDARNPFGKAYLLGRRVIREPHCWSRRLMRVDPA